MPPSLEPLLKAASPRHSVPPTPLRSHLIHGSVALLWLGLFAMAFHSTSVLAWSTGVAYVLYDTVLLVFVFWQTRALARGAVAPAALSAGMAVDVPHVAHPRVSLGVIVAAHNEAAVLPVTLAALLSQSDLPEQIVVADDGSTDDTAAVLQRLYGLAPPAEGAMSCVNVAGTSLGWLRLPHGGKANALNAAVLLMTTETVLTVDGDTLLEHEAVAVVREAFSSEAHLVAATGVLAPVCRPSLGGRLFQWFQTYEYIRNFLSRYAWMQVGGLLLISGAFAGFRRQSVLQVGGFDPDCLVEDYELIHRLRRHAALGGLGWTTRVLGGARARTEAPGTVGAFLRQRRRWFGGFLQTQYWYRDMVGDARYGALGLAMLPVKAIDTFQPLYGLTAFFLLLYYLANGTLGVLVPVAGVIGAKIVIDLGFHLWSVYLYKRWAESDVHNDRKARTGAPRASFLYAVIAALVEPFTFQLLRHTGAAWGWWVFLTGKKQWGRQSRGGLVRRDTP